MTTITLTITLEEGAQVAVTTPSTAEVTAPHLEIVGDLPDEHPDSLFQRTCQKCGAEFKTRNGRLIHNGRVHGDNPDYAAIAAALEEERAKATEPDPTPTGFETYKRQRPLGPLQHSILEVLATRHGRISDPKGGATGRLHELAGATCTQTNFSGTLRRLEELGHIERKVTGRRCYRITLTPGGWDAIGQTPPHSSTVDSAREEPTEPEPAPDVPPMPDLGPIGRRPFDPDDVRRRQAELV